MDRDPDGAAGLKVAATGVAGRALAGRAIAGLAALVVLQLWRLCRANPSLPLWDESTHGFAGVQVADALRHLNPLELAAALNRQVVWPFAHSLLLAPAMLLGGNAVAAAEATSLVLFFATVVLLYLAGSRLHPTRGAWVGLTAATLALLAPSYRLFGTLAMLEIPGAFLLLLAFTLHARASLAPFSRHRLAAAGFATSALFLCKYNYGLMWLIPLAFWEWRLLPEAFRSRAGQAARARMTWRWWRRPMPLVFAVGAATIAAILATGGGEFTLFGLRVSMRSPGNLAYALWLAWLAWMLVPRRASRAAWVWTRLPERARLLAQTIALPLAIWFTLPYPNRVKEFFGFIANRESGPSTWSAQGLLFYPRALAADYSPAAWVAWLVLALAIAAPLTPGFSSRAARLAWLALVVGLAATVLHRYRDSRFFFTVCPLLWLSASRAAVTLADAALARVPARALREGLWTGAAAALLLAAWLGAPLDSDVLARRNGFRAPATVAAAMDEVLEAIAPRAVAPDFAIAAFDAAALDPNRDFPPRAILLGYGNVLSPGLLAWHARLARPEIARARLPKRAPFIEAGAEDAVLDARLGWLEAHSDEVIVALASALPPPLGMDYRRETWGDRETAARLAASANWARVREARLAGWTVTTFRRAR